MSFYGQTLQEDYQVSQSQIIAYKKQLDNRKKEIDEERRRGQQLEAEVYTCAITIYTLGYLVDISNLAIRYLKQTHHSSVWKLHEFSQHGV